MVDVAVAAVLVSGVAVVTSGVVSLVVPLITTKRAASLARETRVQQRLADSYLDVLKIVEREGLWLRAQFYNWEAASKEDDYDPIPRMKVPPPELSDQATVSALLATFGSQQVRDRYEAWRSSVQKLQDANANLNWNMQEVGDPDAQPSAEDLLPMQIAQEAQVKARQALAQAVAFELGHRPSASSPER